MINPKILCTLSAIICTFPIIKGLRNGVYNQKISSLTNSHPTLCDIPQKNQCLFTQSKTGCMSVCVCVKKRHQKRDRGTFTAVDLLQERRIAARASRSQWALLGRTYGALPDLEMGHNSDRVRALSSVEVKEICLLVLMSPGMQASPLQLWNVFTHPAGQPLQIGQQRSGTVFWVLSDWLVFQHSRNTERKKPTLFFSVGTHAYCHFL